MRKVKLFQLLVVLLLFSGSVLSQKISKQAPLNPEFESYLNQKKVGSKTIQGGCMPSPVDYNFDYYYQTKGNTEKTTLPKRYDMRDDGFLTSTKDQGKFGTCWAFASLGALESYLLKNGVDSYDFSEKNMVTCHGFEFRYDEGGFLEMAAAYMVRRNGPINEKEDKYMTLAIKNYCVENLKPVGFVNSTKILPADHELLKKMILRYGAVATTMCYASSQDNATSLYYNTKDLTFYYNGSEPVNHAVLIVGWDDSKVVTGGSSSPKGLNQGAWIVRNSWGEDYGDNGYFYVSYKDSKFLSDNIVFSDFQEYNDNEKIYQYDELGSISSYLGKNNIAYGVTKYMAGSDEFISKIGTWTVSAGTSLDIEVFKNFDPATGIFTDQLAVATDLFCDFPGYHTFEVNTPVSGTFYVKVKYYTPGYNYPLPVETTIREYAEPQIESGVNWRSDDGQTWIALGKGTDDEVDLCVKVYTITDSKPIALFQTDKQEVCLGSELTLTDRSYGAPDSYTWDFGTDATPATATATESTTQSVVYSTAGDKNIRLTVKKGNVENTVTKRITVVSQDLNILAMSERTSVSSGKSVLLMAFGDANSYSWSPSTDLETTDGALVYCKPTSLGDYEYTVTGTQGTCAGSATINFTVNKAPDNDDVANAIKLSFGKNGPYSNLYATVEDNEPYPDTTLVVALENGGDEACNSQYTWCHEGGLHNSIWFKIVPTEAGVVSIDSYGIDNQLALYDADTYEDLFVKGRHTLLAANDDYHPESKSFSAAILPVENLTPGRTYWLQADGSAGGSIGSMTIYVYAGSLSVADNDLNERVVVYPNPAKEEINIKIYPNFEKEAVVNVVDIQGKTVYTQKLTDIAAGLVETISLRNIAKGVYNVQFVFDGKMINRKIVVE